MPNSQVKGRCKMIVVRAFLILAVCAQALWAQTLSIADCDEIYRQYGITPDSCAATSTPPSPASNQRGMDRRIRESHIFFRSGGARLDRAAIEQVQKLALVLETRPLSLVCIQLIGHSDALGSAEANMALSERRAEVVSNALRQQLVDPSRVEAVLGKGEEQLLAGFEPNASQHRRVEIRARKCPMP